jgi:hypothetical protein
MTSTIADVETDTGRMVPPPAPWAWAVTFGEFNEHRVVVHSESEALLLALHLHGQTIALRP